MIVEKLLYDCLKDTNGGFFALMAPQNRSKPYSVYKVISDIKTYALEGQCDYPQTRFQINVYGDDLSKIIEISEDIQTDLMAYKSFSCIIHQTFSDVQDEGPTYRIVIDFTCIGDITACPLYPRNLLYPNKALYPCS